MCLYMVNDLNQFHSSSIPKISNPKIYIEVIYSNPFVSPVNIFQQIFLTNSVNISRPPLGSNTKDFRVRRH